jgi:hypothetical protein
MNMLGRRWMRPGRVRFLLIAIAVTLVGSLVFTVAGSAGAASRGRGDKKVVLAPPELRGPPANRSKDRQSRPKNLTSAARPTPGAPADVVDPVDLELLVISADGNETDFPYLRATLDQIGVPYTVLIATEQTLTPGFLADSSTHGRYQGIILTTGNLTYYDGSAWTSAFTDAEWQTLWEYERQFGVRQVTSYTFPQGLPEGTNTGAYGLYMPQVEVVDTTFTPLDATLTAAGRAVFPYLNSATPITFENAWVYMATEDTCEAAAGCESLTPLITTGDGHVIAIVKRYTDGRLNLAGTAANAPYLLHSSLLSYGVVNWVTRGLFLGERHVNLDIQVDDMLLDDDIWDPDANSDQTGLTYRLTGSDFNAARAWQAATRSTNAVLAGLRLEYAFNGEGASGIYADDTLTPAVKSGEESFAWVNHGWEHLDLDTADVATATREIQDNIRAAGRRMLDLSMFSRDSYVQADIGGLGNPAFLQAAAQLGVKYLISDTSRPGGDNPSPNAGRYSPLQPSILVIPRRPTNLFYNLATPEEWVDEYNYYYGPGGVWAYWDHDLSYEEILDHESDTLLLYMLRWDLDPWMFHQPNLAVDGTGNTLLTDLLDLTLQKYVAHYTLPIRNLTEHGVGILMAQRMAYNASDVTASMTPCARGKTQVTFVAQTAATVPVTGLTVGKSEVYGGQPISTLSLSAGETRTIRADCTP